MKKFLFIGIDFSKSKFYNTVLKGMYAQDSAQATFENESKGLSKQSNLQK